MRLVMFVMMLVAGILATRDVSAATYKVSVKSSLERFSLDGYSLNSNDFSSQIYSVSGKDDPVLENFPWKNFIEGAFSGGGSMRFTERFYDGGERFWRGSGCTGVFAFFDACGGEFWGHLSKSHVELQYSRYWLHQRIDTGTGTIEMATDLDYRWINALGENSVDNGEYMAHRIESISVSQVPVPASGVLMLVSLFGFFGARVLRRR